MPSISKELWDAVRTGKFDAIQGFKKWNSQVVGPMPYQAPLLTNNKIIYVKQKNLSPVENGQSWRNAYTDLQLALDEVVPGTRAEIWVARGVYVPTKIYMGNGGAYGLLNPGVDLTHLITFELPDGVEIYGGFKGCETKKCKRKPWFYKTILSGSRTSWHTVILGNDVAQYTDRRRAQLNGVTVNLGVADGPSGGNTIFMPFSYNHGYGGGIYAIFGSKLTLIDSVIENNKANGQEPQNTSGGIGGGIFSLNCFLRFAGNTFKNNYTSLQAGGLAVYHTYEPFSIQSYVHDCDFSNNNTSTFGGAIVSEGAFPGPDTLVTFTGCNFVENTSAEGGAFVNDSLRVLLKGCNFYNNTGFVSAGGFATTTIVQTLVSSIQSLPQPSPLSSTLIGCCFQNNLAQGNQAIRAGILGGIINIAFPIGGGAVVCYVNGELNLIDCKFDGNQALNSNGGTIVNGMSAIVLAGTIQNAKTTVINCTFEKGYAIRGGAIASEADITFGPADPNVTVLTVDECSTFDCNSASLRGGAIYLKGSTAIIPTKYNCNRAPVGSAVYAEPGSVVNGVPITVPYVVEAECDCCDECEENGCDRKYYDDCVRDSSSEDSSYDETPICSAFTNELKKNEDNELVITKPVKLTQQNRKDEDENEIVNPNVPQAKHRLFMNADSSKECEYEDIESSYDDF